MEFILNPQNQMNKHHRPVLILKLPIYKYIAELLPSLTVKVTSYLHFNYYPYNLKYLIINLL